VYLNEPKKPKVYTAEFRESSVKLAIESDKPIAQTARDIGANENTLHTWMGNILLKTLTVTLRLLAKRWLMLSAELKELDASLDHLTSLSAKRLRSQFGVGPQTAAVLIAVAGDIQNV